MNEIRTALHDYQHIIERADEVHIVQPLITIFLETLMMKFLERFVSEVDQQAYYKVSAVNAWKLHVSFESPQLTINISGNSDLAVLKSTKTDEAISSSLKKSGISRARHRPKLKESLREITFLVEVKVDDKEFSNGGDAIIE